MLNSNRSCATTRAATKQQTLKSPKREHNMKLVHSWGDPEESGGPDPHLLKITSCYMFPSRNTGTGNVIMDVITFPENL